MTNLNMDNARNLFATLNEVLGDVDLTSEQKHKAIFSDTLANQLSEALLVPLEGCLASDKGEVDEFYTKCKAKMEYMLSLDTQYPGEK